MITSAKFTESGSIIAIIDDVTMTVPDDMANRHRVMIDEWINEDPENHIIEPYEPPYPTADDVNTERSRRIALGTIVTLSDGSQIPLQGRPEDVANIQSLASVAMVMKTSNIPYTFNFRDADNALHELSSDQMIELQVLGAAYISKLYDKSWTIKKLDPIPRDFRDDEYWVES